MAKEKKTLIYPVGSRTAIYKDPSDALLTKEEVAKVLRVTNQTIGRWAKYGDFNTYRHRGEVRFLKSEIVGMWLAPDIPPRKSLVRGDLLKSVKLKDGMDALLTRKEAAKLVGVSESTINKWSMEGDFSTYRCRGEVRYLKSELLGEWTTLFDEVLN